MKCQLIVTVIAKDKPGIVEALARTVSQQGGNWEESRLVNLCGKFTGLLLVSVDAARLEALKNDLTALSASGIRTQVEEVQEEVDVADSMELGFNLIGADRPGIVREIAQALAARNINVEELNTDYSSMPWSGEPLFQAMGALRVPADSDLDELAEKLDQIADELGVDIELELPETEGE